MDKNHRNFLEENGLPPNATEQEAAAHAEALKKRGIEYIEPQDTAEPAPPPETRTEPAPPETRTEPAPPITKEQLDEAARAAARTERARVEEIRALADRFGVPDDQVKEWIDKDATISAARSAILDYLQQHTPSLAGHTGVQIGTEERDKFRAAVCDGVMLQMGHKIDKPAPGADDYRRVSPLDLARICLERAGIRTANLSKFEIAKRALIPHSTSDFPTLLGGIGKEAIAQGYQESGVQTWRQFAATTTAADFRDMYTYDFTGAFDLRLVRENGEYETVDAKESAQRYRIAKYGRVFPYTFEMLTNDRWGLFAEIPRRFGAGALRLENNVVYEALTGNQALLADGRPLFDASRNNIMPAAALSEDSLKTAILALRQQRGEDGEYLDLRPAILLVSPLDEFRASVLVNSTGNVGAQLNAGVINPLFGIVQVISDPRVADGAWYLFAAPAQAAVIEVAWLDGQQTPYIDEDIDFITDGVRVKCRHCFGAGLLGWRGAIYNPGPGSGNVTP